MWLCCKCELLLTFLPSQYPYMAFDLLVSLDNWYLRFCKNSLPELLTRNVVVLVVVYKGRSSLFFCFRVEWFWQYIVRILHLSDWSDFWFRASDWSDFWFRASDWLTPGVLAAWECKVSKPWIKIENQWNNTFQIGNWTVVKTYHPSNCCDSNSLSSQQCSHAFLQGTI